MNEDYFGIIEQLLQQGIPTPGNPRISNQSFTEYVSGRTFASPEELIYTGVEGVSSRDSGGVMEFNAPLYQLNNSDGTYNFTAGPTTLLSVDSENIVRNNTYIGGTPEQSRNTWWNTYPEINTTIQEVNQEYGLPENLLKTLLSVEGSFVDSGIQSINRSRGRYSYGQSAIDIYNPTRGSFVDLVDIGYDIVNEPGEWEKISPYLQNEISQPDLHEFENEKGQPRNSGVYKGEGAFNNAIEIVAAKNRQLLDKVNKDAANLGINLTEEQQSYWTNVYWNSGESAGPRLLQEYKGQYIPPTYNGKVTAGTNGEKFLRQYRTYAEGGPITADDELTFGNIVVGNNVDFDNVDPVLRGILNEYQNRGVSLRVTSGKASDGHSTNSRHYTGEAIDITPVSGESYEFLLSNFRRHPDLIQRLQDAGYGVLDETKGGGQGWTGAHLHIGKDSKLDKNSWNTLTVKDFSNKPGKLSENAQLATEYFLGRGLSPIATAGIVGNLIQESSENILPTAFNKKEGAFGIAQWRGERLDNLSEFANTSGVDRSSISTQLDFLYNELTTKYPKAYNSLINAQTPEEAADVFNRYYERSADVSGTAGYNRRINSANLIFSDINRSFAQPTDEIDYITVNPNQLEYLAQSLQQFSQINSSYNPVQQVVDYYSADNESIKTPEYEKDMQNRAKLSASDDTRELINYLLGSAGVSIVTTNKI